MRASVLVLLQQRKAIPRATTMNPRPLNPLVSPVSVPIPSRQLQFNPVVIR
jgi:hypothetical protein